MKPYYFIFIALFLFSCQEKAKELKTEDSQQTTTEVADPLPSWNATSSKTAIIDFVTQVTKEGSDKFIPVEERIATFDNDGTLWCEQPLYTEMLYSIDMTKIIATQYPELSKKPEIKALVSGDMATFMKSGEKGILEAFAISHSAVKPEQFDQMAKAWLDTATDKRFNQRYVDLVYKPMVELLIYLQNNQFKTYIVSGGSSAFIRNFSVEAYNIPPEQVIGTMLKAEYTEQDKDIKVKPEVWHNDDKAGKPEAIFQIIGRKPVLAFGNSDGDFQMLQWASTHTRPNLSLILHHTDAEREYAYDSLSHVGTLKRGLVEGPANGWIIVDMKKDFNQIFPFEE